MNSGVSGHWPEGVRSLEWLQVEKARPRGGKHVQEDQLAQSAIRTLHRRRRSDGSRRPEQGWPVLKGGLMVTTNAGPGRPHLVNASTDPVVVGLGRLLVGMGVVALAGILTLLWILFTGFRAI